MASIAHREDYDSASRLRLVPIGVSSVDDLPGAFRRIETEKVEGALGMTIPPSILLRATEVIE
jgi:hypothetical protein